MQSLQLYLCCFWLVWWKCRYSEARSWELGSPLKQSSKYKEAFLCQMTRKWRLLRTFRSHFCTHGRDSHCGNQDKELKGAVLIMKWNKLDSNLSCGILSLREKNFKSARIIFWQINNPFQSNWSSLDISCNVFFG